MSPSKKKFKKNSIDFNENNTEWTFFSRLVDVYGWLEAQLAIIGIILSHLHVGRVIEGMNLEIATTHLHNWSGQITRLTSVHWGTEKGEGVGNVGNFYLFFYNRTELLITEYISQIALLLQSYSIIF